MNEQATLVDSERCQWSSTAPVSTLLSLRGNPPERVRYPGVLQILCERPVDTKPVALATFVSLHFALLQSPAHNPGRSLPILSRLASVCKPNSEAYGGVG